MNNSVLIGITRSLNGYTTNNVFNVGEEKYDRVYEQYEWGKVQNMLIEKDKIIPTYMLSKEERDKRFIRENIYTFESFITEAIKTEVPFIISERLEGLLSNIDHPIAYRMIKESNNINIYSKEATLIDYDDNDTDKFTFTSANKFEDALKNTLDIKYSTADIKTLYDIMKVNKELYEELRTSIKIGRLVNKLYPSEYTPNGKNSIEDFVNAVKLSRNRTFKNFEIVNGKDIVKYYYRDNYDDDAFDGSELGNSCMSYSYCSSYINFYAINPGVSLLILKSDKEEGKIVGRALLWDIGTVNGKEVKGKFMDRVYYTKNYQKELFIEHAKNNGWYCYEHGNLSSNIWNPDKNKHENIQFSTVIGFVKSPTDEYPYMDTMQYFYIHREFLSNSSSFEESNEPYYYLDSTDGGYTVENDEEYDEDNSDISGW